MPCEGLLDVAIQLLVGQGALRVNRKGDEIHNRRGGTDAPPRSFTQV
jgi:hypothetical protein